MGSLECVDLIRCNGRWDFNFLFLRNFVYWDKCKYGFFVGVVLRCVLILTAAEPVIDIGY